LSLKNIQRVEYYTIHTQQQHIQSTPVYPGWYETKAVLAHQKGGSRMFYKVIWTDDFTSCLQEKDISVVAIDAYWLEKHAKAKPRRDKRQSKKR